MKCNVYACQLSDSVQTFKMRLSHTEDKQQTLKRYNPYNLNIFISVYFFLFSESYLFVKAVVELSN